MERQVAVLIDGDNISPKYAECIKQEAMAYGNIKVFRLHGSVNSPKVKSWYKVMPLQGIVPMLQISYANGKSIADQSLTIDAMDLLYTAGIDVFCIVSSDSDYVKLIYRLKEAGKLVIGMGEKKVKEALAKACDEFKILDLIYRNTGGAEEAEEPEEMTGQAVAKQELSVDTGEKEGAAEEPEETEGAGDAEISIPSEGEIIAGINDYIDSSDDDRINLAAIGTFLKTRFLGFDSRNYGYSNMTKMIENHKDTFEVHREKAPDGIHGIVYISRNKRGYTKRSGR